MRIGIFGVGAIGGFLAAMLAEAGHRISVVARGAHLAALRKDGLRFEMKDRTLVSKPAASDKPADLGPQDYVMVAVKAPAMPSVARDLAPLLGPETPIVSVLNGIPWWFFNGLAGHTGRRLQSVDADGSLNRMIDPARILGCVVHAGCAVPAPGVVRHTAGNHLIVGEACGGLSARVTALTDALAGAGFKADATKNIQQDIWMKYLGNMSMNPVSVLTGGTLRQIARDPGAAKVCIDMMEEAVALGRKFDLDPGISVQERLELGAQIGDFKTSMLQDFEKNRPMEIDAFLGAALEMAEIAGVEVPAIRTVHGLLVQKARLAGLYPAA